MHLGEASVTEGRTEQLHALYYVLNVFFNEIWQNIHKLSGHTWLQEVETSPQQNAWGSEYEGRGRLGGG